MYQMNFSEYCPPAAMCEASVKKKSPTSLRGGTDWHRLEVAEVGDCVCSDDRLRHSKKTFIFTDSTPSSGCGRAAFFS